MDPRARSRSQDPPPGATFRLHPPPRPPPGARVGRSRNASSGLKSRPLPRSLDPLPDESLPGFLLRLAYRLEVSPARLVARTGLSVNIEHRITAPFSLTMQLAPEARDGLARAARLTPREVADLCLNSLAERYSPASTVPTHRRWNQLNRQSRWVFINATRYCPDCLADNRTAIQRELGGAWRKTWRLPPVFACTSHRRFLEHLCPTCRRPALDCTTGNTCLPALPHWHHRRLHPAQCRIAVQDGDAPAARRPACGTKLDNPRLQPSTVSIPKSLVGFQQQILDILQRSKPDVAPTAGRQTTPAVYFVDLRLMTYLIRASWPRARDLVPTPALAEAIERHAKQELQQLAGQRLSRGIHPRDIHDTPPLDPVPCAALLATADRLLSCDTVNVLSGHLRHLLSADTRRGLTGWRREFLARPPDCSDGFRQAIVRVLETWA